MNKNEAIQFYNQYTEKLNAYALALNTISFDQATIAPKKGNDYRIQMMGILNGERFDYMCDPDNLAKLEAMSQLDLGDMMNEELRQTLKILHQTSRLPRDFYIKYGMTMNLGEEVWKEAKQKNDYSIFKNVLLEIIEISKQYAHYIDPDHLPYNVMLDLYEEGMTMDQYDEFFNIIKSQLLPFIQRIIHEGKNIDDSAFTQNYPEADQIKVMDILKEYMQFDADECYLGVSAHPFTSKFSSGDVRITTKYDENNLMSSIFSIIHEYGHAIYGLHVDKRYEGYTLADNISSGMHESQSRLLENYIGKCEGFWIQNFEKMKAIFPSQFNNIDFDQFMKMMNVSKPSFIRTDADELTYPIHILIRYELEKAIFNENMDCSDLDKVWADKYEEYLGIRPSTVSQGILQDIHWSGGSFGYFPTYALGSAYGAQFFEAMCKQINVNQELADNHFEVIEHWLTENIHQHGSFKNANQLLLEVCQETFNPQIYVDYLIKKFSKIYEIDA